MPNSQKGAPQTGKSGVSFLCKMVEGSRICSYTIGTPVYRQNQQEGCFGLSEPTLFSAEKLLAFCTKVLSLSGVPNEYAQVVADSLIHADLHGIDSHGIARLPIYVKRILHGGVEKELPPLLLKEHEAAVLIDGQNGLGAVVGNFALKNAMERAKRFGIGVAGVRNSNHFGACSYFAKQVVGEDMILFVFSNAPQVMAPTGGIGPFFGSNPLSVAIPTGQQVPFLLDMATSVAARGKIALAAQSGESIPESWAISSTGEPTTDPYAALQGALLPIGGPKGYGMAMFIDILCGILTGAGHGDSIVSLYDHFDKPQKIGHFFLTIHIDHFLPLSQFKATMDRYITRVKAVPKAPHVTEILIPGEMEHRTAIYRRKNGIPLSPQIVAQLDELGKRMELSIFEAMLAS